MTMDLRHLALILEAGRNEALDLTDEPAAAVLAAVLARMEWEAVNYALEQAGEGTPFDVERDFAELAAKHRGAGDAKPSFVPTHEVIDYPDANP